VDWIACLEKEAQESGRALTPIEFNLAQRVGVAHPEEVRVLSVPRIPLPSHPRVKQLARRTGLLNADTGGLTVGYGVIVRRDCANNLRLLAHEFVHVAQYERLGKVGFLQEYIQRIAAHGYPNAPFELEAEAKATRACRCAGLASATRDHRRQPAKNRPLEVVDREKAETYWDIRPSFARCRRLILENPIWLEHLCCSSLRPRDVS